MAKTPAAVEQFLGRLVPPSAANAAREAARHPGAHRPAARRLQARAVGLGLLRRAGAQGEVRPEQRGAQALLRAEPRAPERRVLRRAPALRHHASRSATTSRSTSPTCACSRCSTPTASRSALFYCDYFKRDNKNGGAWMDNFVRPVASCSAPGRSSTTSPTSPSPPPGQPALLSFDDVTTMFHEFGHALHGMFADVELPDAVGHQRGARLRRVPVAVQRALGALAEGARALREALQDRRADAAGAGRQDREGGDVQPGLRPDRDPWRPRCSTCTGTRCRPRAPAAGPGRVRDRGAREGAASTCAPVPPRYRSSYFLHIWANGYAAGYYAYLWTEMLDDDAFAVVRGARRPDARQRRPVPHDDPVARQRRRLREAVPGLPRPGPEHRADAQAAGDYRTK